MFKIELVEVLKIYKSCKSSNRKAKTRPELMGVRTSLSATIPQYKMDVDIEKQKAKV